MVAPVLREEVRSEHSPVSSNPVPLKVSRSHIPYLNLYEGDRGPHKLYSSPAEARDSRETRDTGTSKVIKCFY